MSGFLASGCLYSWQKRQQTFVNESDDAIGLQEFSHIYNSNTHTTNVKIGTKTICCVYPYKDKRFHLWVNQLVTYVKVNTSTHSHTRIFALDGSQDMRNYGKGCYNTYLSFYYDIIVHTECSVMNGSQTLITFDYCRSRDLREESIFTFKRHENFLLQFWFH